MNRQKNHKWVYCGIFILPVYSSSSWSDPEKFKYHYQCKKDKRVAFNLNAWGQFPYQSKNLSLLCVLRNKCRWLFSIIILATRIRNILIQEKTNICSAIQVHVYFLFLSFLLFHISRRKQLQIQQINFFSTFLRKWLDLFLCVRIYIL